MSGMRKITVELPEAAVRAIEADVAAGLYASESEAVADAILSRDGCADDISDEELRAAVQVVFDDPRPDLTLEEAVERLRKAQEVRLNGSLRGA